MNCPYCQSDVWDNRGKEKSPKAPQFKCKNRDCSAAGWIDRKDKTKVNFQDSNGNKEIVPLVSTTTKEKTNTNPTVEATGDRQVSIVSQTILKCLATIVAANKGTPQDLIVAFDEVGGELLKRMLGTPAPKAKASDIKHVSAPVDDDEPSVEVNEDDDLSDLTDLDFSM